jgi:hypothetical protein
LALVIYIKVNFLAMDGHLNFLSTVRYQSLTQKDCLQILIQRVEEFHIFRPNLEVKYLAVLQDPVFMYGFWNYDKAML